MSHSHFAETLINELMHNANAAGNKPLERRLADLTLWFYRNKGDIPTDNYASRAAFLEKTMWILLEVCALQTERIHELETAKRGSASLYLPKGVQINGSVKEYG